MIYFTKSKINIGLSITEKRKDGYHNLESIFYPIDLGDCLEINKSQNTKEKISFETSGIKIPSNDSDNLVVQAYHLLDAKFDLDPIQCHLLKTVPTGAGIGGGSADAAYMIKGLNDFFKLKLSDLQMEEFSLEIGSDCPFFIKSKPAFVKGRGEFLEETSLDLKGKIIVLVKPNLHISTGSAFSNLTPSPSSFDLKTLHSTPISEWKEFVVNDFEKYAFSEHPELKKIKEELYGLGAEYASMSGSGSSIYGIFGEDVVVEGIWWDCFVWKGVL